MHTRSTLGFCTLFVAGLSQGQLVEVLDESNNLVNEQDITVLVDPTVSFYEVSLPVVLQGADAAEVNVVRYEEDACPGTQNYFCWGECWLPVNAGAQPTWNAIDPVTLSPGVEFTGFHAYWKPFGQQQTCCFLFTWHRVSDYNDSTWVRICFDSMPFSVDDLSAAGAGFDLFPNPANGGEVGVSFDHPITEGRTELVWHSALGGAVRATPLPKGVGRTTVSTEGLAQGVWFAELRVNGTPAAVRRVVVN
jgi:hypothetical protein